jgi:hypothetical protein
VLTHGGLKGYKPIADAKRTMQPRKYSIEWQSIVGAPI